MLPNSINKARERVSALRRTVELLRADSDALAERREAFLEDGEQVLSRLRELDSAKDSERQGLTSECAAMMSRLEGDAVRLQEEWTRFLLSLEACTSVPRAACVIPSAHPPTLRAMALGQLLGRMETGPGSYLLRTQTP